MKILIADDDELVLKLLDETIRAEGFDTVLCTNGEDALKEARSQNIDFVVLDVMMPGIDGFHVCKELQDTGIPIMLLTAKSDISDRLIGLEYGADDYMVKPFDCRELVARINSILRRIEKAKSKLISNPGSDPDRRRGIIIEETSMEVYIDGAKIKLTLTEYNLLLLFYNNPNRVFERNRLLDLVWGYEFAGDTRTVDIHIQRLRKKLGQWESCIETVFGVGYRFKVNRDED